MSLNSFLKEKTRRWLIENEEPTHINTKRRLQNEDFESFEDARLSQENPLWAEIDLFLNVLRATHPLKAETIRANIKWLRRQAKKQKLGWGK